MADAPEVRTVELVLPLPPSSNRYYRHVGNRVLLSREARAYRDRCRLVAVAQYGGELLGGRVRVVADVYMSLRGDLDNRIKQLLDGLEGAVIENDRQVVDLHLRRHLDRENPRVEFAIEEVEWP